MDIAADAEGFELFAEQVRSGLTGILCDDNASDVKTDIAECFCKTQHLEVISQTEITACFVGFQRTGGDRDDDFCLIL